MKKKILPKISEDGIKDTKEILTNILAHDKDVRVVLNGMLQYGCPISKNYFLVVECATPTYAFLNALPSYDNEKYPEGIYLCWNNLNRDSAKIKHAVTHELLHLYDYCRSFMTEQCLLLACTEIRAANLSGECNFSRRRSGFGWFSKKYECVRKTAIASMNGYEHCREKINSYIAQAWGLGCYEDTAPFTTTEADGWFGLFNR